MVKTRTTLGMETLLNRCSDARPMCEVVAVSPVT